MNNRRSSRSSVTTMANTGQMTVPNTWAQGLTAQQRIRVIRVSPRTGSLTCECGAPSTKRYGCTECRYLDGNGRTVTAIIGALRSLGRGATLEELLEVTGTPFRETLQRAMYHLMTVGRIRRYENNESLQPYAHGSHQWVYTLTEAR